MANHTVKSIIIMLILMSALVPAANAGIIDNLRDKFSYLLSVFTDTGDSTEITSTTYCNEPWRRDWERPGCWSDGATYYNMWKTNMATGESWITGSNYIYYRPNDNRGFSNTWAWTANKDIARTWGLPYGTNPNNAGDIPIDPTPAPTPRPTAQPTVTNPVITDTPPPSGTPPVIKTKPVIVPPTISRLLSLMSGWFMELFGLTISGGQSLAVPVGQPYTTQISLDFAPPDTNYDDGTYEAKFAEYFVVDSKKTVIMESGWTQELTASPWTVTATFTPPATGTYYLVAIVNKQTYTYSGGKWTAAEAIETKELQRLVINPPSVGAKPTGSARSLFQSLDFSAWFNDILSWLRG